MSVMNQTTLTSNVSAFGNTNQQKLHNSRVSIFGQNELSDYITMQLVGLGVGEILIQGERNEPGLHMCMDSIDSNPHTNIKRYNGRALHYRHNKFQPDFTFQTETSTNEKKDLDSFTRDLIGKTCTFDIEHRKNSFNTTLLAGFAVDQFRKTKFQLNKTDNVNKEFILEYTKLLGHNVEHVSKRDINHALVIGAGGIGTYVGLELAKARIPQISIVDGDVVEAKNLNRQLLYLNSIGDPKASSLATQLQQFSPESTIQSYQMYLHTTNQIADLVLSKKIDFVYCATDNFESRLAVSKVCEVFQIPLVEGGCNTTNAVVSQYEPGHTSPVHVTRNFASYIKPPTTEKKQTSCIEQANPSVVIPNAIAGALMYGVSQRRFDKENMEVYLKHTLHYDTFSKEPFSEVIQ